MDRSNKLSKELEECRTKLSDATAELEELKKSKKAPDGKCSSSSEIRLCEHNEVS